MLRSLIQAAILLLFLVAGSAASTCLTTLPSNPPFIPLAAQGKAPIGKDHLWYGTEALWTLLPLNGTWDALPGNEKGYRQKVFWWSEGYDRRAKPRPKMILIGRRLDGDAPSIAVLESANSYDPFGIGSAMLTMVNIPTEGCWEFTGHYDGHTLAFVVSVGH